MSQSVSCFHILRHEIKDDKNDIFVYACFWYTDLNITNLRRSLRGNIYNYYLG